MARHNTIGIISPVLSGFYFDNVLAGIISVTQQHNLQLLMFEGAPQDLYPARLAIDAVDGWIVLISHEGIEHLSSAGTPAVTISAAAPDLFYPAVMPDNRGGIADAVRHLVDAHGFRRIAYGGALHLDDPQQRFEGYKQGLADRGIELDESLVFNAGGNRDYHGAEVAEQLIARGIPCDAMIMGTDWNAIGLIKTLQSRGYHVPEDLAVVGFDDISVAQYNTPPLATLRYRYDQLGTRAAELLLRQIAGEKVPGGFHYVTTTMIPRRSCGCETVLVDSPDSAVRIGEQGWQDDLARQLVTLTAGDPAVVGQRHPTEIWPGVATLITALDAAVEGVQGPPISALETAWQQAVGLTSDLETLQNVIKILEGLGKQRLSTSGEEAGGRVDLLLDRANLELRRAHLGHEMARINYLETLVQTNHAISATLSGGQIGSLLKLDWLGQAQADWGCLALWDESELGKPASLTIASAYSPDGSATALLGSQLPARTFPPSEILPRAVDGEPRISMLLPIRTNTRNWGVLAARGSLQNQLSGYTSMWAALLSAILESETLLQSLKEQQVALIKAKTAAEEANQLKSQFLANMSHELRTPLNAIINFSRILMTGMHGPLSENQSSYLGHVVQSGEHLLELINDILDLSKIEARRMELVKGQIYVNEIVQSVMPIAGGLTKGKPIELKQEVEPDLPAVVADRTRIRQILLNLVSNAAKFTHAGAITLGARREGEMIVLSVRDTGIGIAPEHVSVIFDEFRQIDSAHNRQYQGTGLGLAICRRFVELHGGKIWVESAPGEGATFSFSLPLSGMLSAPPQVSAVLSAPKRAGPNVLVIDDDPAAIEIVSAYLGQHGYAVHGIQDSRMAMTEVRRLNPVAIILDVMMPHKDGWEVLSELKLDPELARIPVVLYTMVEEQQLGFYLGASAYLTKPINEQQLCATVAQLVSRGSQVLVVDDDPNALEIVSWQLEKNGGYNVFTASGGQQGLDKAREHQPHLIILDLMMPEVDGFSVLQQLDQDEQLRQIPVIVLTAQDLTSDEHAYLTQRVHWLLNKALTSPEQLLSKVTALLNSFPEQA